MTKRSESEVQWPRIEDVHTLVFDFDGVFTDNKVYVDQQGGESVRCDRGDGLGMDMLRAYQRKAGLALEMFVLSKERNPVVLARTKKIKLNCHHGVDNKLDWLERHLAARGMGADSWRGVVYLGNDLNDLPIINQGVFSVVPQDSHPRILARADAVMPRSGGDGFVRAVVERLLNLDNLDDEKINELIHYR